MTMNTDTYAVELAGTDNLIKLDRAFFCRSAPELARALLGAILVRRVDGVLRYTRLLETEAYCGPKDLASHSSRGRTARTEVMFGPPGHAYVYFIYGMYWMFNVVGGTEGGAHAVLVRSAQPLDGWGANMVGPGRLARALGFARSDNGLDLCGDHTFFLSDADYRPRIVRSKRIGVDYARHWKDRLLRFVDAKNPLAAKVRVKSADVG